MRKILLTLSILTLSLFCFSQNKVNILIPSDIPKFKYMGHIIEPTNMIYEFEGRLVENSYYEKLTMQSCAIRTYGVLSKCYGTISSNKGVGWTSQTYDVYSYFEDVSYFSENMAPIKYAGLWGFIDVNGYLIIPTMFKSVDDFIDGKCIVVDVNNKSHTIVKVGNLYIMN